MRKPVVVVTVEELKKSGKCRSSLNFTIDKPAKRIPAAKEKSMLQDLFDNLRSDRLMYER